MDFIDYLFEGIFKKYFGHCPDGPFGAFCEPNGISVENNLNHFGEFRFWSKKEELLTGQFLLHLLNYTYEGFWKIKLVRIGKTLK